ncbi:MAG: methylmalonyl-CoA mutase [Deltaproteobacteria bacterium]|nr:methylmalonyl-CoA mutase [Deltaproteobacteria bacterium]MBW1925527.1 methylmalonyl-CoA mutase [Deltaproteobacteria bacterium]MBW1951009.1 methylmalonyl-CoA mutase [Deltaproteobacteria bacterium]MBW2009181.1 methylmalonyl-CoA mutase [Deltaproteobacteria bacterium]MBW2348425.1 methylmalonyl-CoA mutase [Deltaproteobacteria bacterium]
MKELDEIRERLKAWEEREDVASLPEAVSDLNEPLKVVYTPLDTAGIDYLEKIGLPGEYPYTRGVYPGMYRVRPWAMRLYSGFGTAEDTNRRWKFLLEKGNNGVACAFDLPTQMGLDSDDPEAEDEVGRVGVAIDSLRDMEILYEGLPLDRLVSSFNINAPAAVILAMYVALGEKEGVPPGELKGTLSNDILCEYVSRGMWVFSAEPALRLTTDVVEYCTRHMPRFYPFNIRGIIMREAGASMVQEAGFAFSNAITYIQSALERGLDVDAFARRVSFFFSTGTQIFEEAARYRAARRLWARIMKERFGAKRPDSLLFRFTGTVGGSFYRAQEPQNNLIRGAYGLLGNVLGGVQGMLHPALDEPFAIPTEETAKLALRTQQICAYETGVTKVVDPLGGSYYVEALTDHLEEEIEKTIHTVDRMGGAVPAIEKGYMQQCIADEAYRAAMEEKSGKRIIVAVNRFQGEPAAGKMQYHRFDPAMYKRQVTRTAQVRKERNNDAAARALRRLKEEAGGGENLIPCLVETVKTYATLGEIMKALKEVFGTFEEPLLV